MDTNTPYFLQLTRDEQKAALEAIIFTSEESVPMKTIMKLLVFQDFHPNREKNKAAQEDEAEENNGQGDIEAELLSHYNIDKSYFEDMIDEINNELMQTNRPFQIVKVAGGFQYATRQEYGELIVQLIKSRSKRKLTQATLEALAIVAYKQPVTKPEVDQIRGVNSADIINSLIEKNLIRIVGRRDTLGKPLLYGTTPEFLRTFGLDTLEDLPKLKELEDLAKTLTDEEAETDEIVITVDEKIEIPEAGYFVNADFEEFDIDSEESLSGDE